MNTAVFYFGGYHAKQLDIDKWVRSAQIQKPHVEFIGFRWPEGAHASPAKSAVDTFTKGGKLDAVIDDIQSNDADKIFIVGHSSGCAIANAVHAGLEYTGHHALIVLDGFGPNADQLDQDLTQVWGALCDGVQSRNFPDFANGHRKIFKATACKSEWALHFSLVNANSKDGVVTDVATGYTNCKANLGFMDVIPASP